METIQFKDENLKSAILSDMKMRRLIDLAAKEITEDDALKVRKLDLSNNGIQSIEAIENFKNLKSLNLVYNQVSDLSPLAKLTNLTKLYLAYNNISDISALASLPELTDLTLEKNQVSDLTPLAGLTNLTQIDTRNQPVTSQPKSSKVDRKKEIKELAAKIDEAVKNYALDPDALYELFLFQQQFREYSMNNVILIYKQREGALQVAPFSKWKEQGYNVRKGEHALKIFAPCLTSFVYDKDKNVICRLKDATPEQKKLITSGEYTVERKKTGYTLVPVFDISQTDCPIEKYPKAFSQDFILGNDVHATTLFSIIKDFLCDELGHSVSFASDQERADVLNGARGVTMFPRDDNSSEPVKILIDATLPENQQLKTLAHETAHALLHNPHTNVDKNTALPRALQEYQAELCAGIVSQYYGIDSMRANASYIAGWVGDEEVPEAEKNNLLKQVLSAAEQVITYTDYVLEHTYHLTHEDFSKSEKKDEMTTPAAIKEDDIGYYNHNDYWKVEFNETDSSIPLLSYSGRIVNDDLIDHLKVLNFELSSAGSIDSGYYKFYFDHYVNGKCVDHIRLDFGEIDPADTNSELDLLKPSTREALDTSLRTNTDSLSESHTQQAGDIFTSTLDAAEKQAAAENTHRPPHTPPEQER